jgi:hypothetical protein
MVSLCSETLRCSARPDGGPAATRGKAARSHSMMTGRAPELALATHEATGGGKQVVALHSLRMHTTEPRRAVSTSQVWRIQVVATGASAVDFNCEGQTFLLCQNCQKLALFDPPEALFSSLVLSTDYGIWTCIMNPILCTW